MIEMTLVRDSSAAPGFVTGSSIRILALPIAAASVTITKNLITILGAAAPIGVPLVAIISTTMLSTTFDLKHINAALLAW